MKTDMGLDMETDMETGGAISPSCPDGAFTQEIRAYWTSRADGYSAVNRDELAGDQARRWSEALLGPILACPAARGRRKEELRVLDAGTGPGFFAIILAAEGLQVSAADMTDEMLAEARRNAGALAERIDWQRTDVQQTAYAEESFDAIVTRNVTWNLTEPEKAYREWHRILRKGGVLINYDANWYRYLADPSLRSEFLQDRENTAEAGVEDFYEGTDEARMEAIARRNPLTYEQRPAWDREVCEAIGFASVRTDEDAWRRVLSEAEKINYASTPVFEIICEK